MHGPKALRWKGPALVLLVAGAAWLLRPATVPTPDTFKAREGRVLLLSVDGLDWDRLQPLASVLPNLLQLRQSGLTVPFALPSSPLQGPNLHPAQLATNLATGRSAVPANDSRTPHRVLTNFVMRQDSLEQVPVHSLIRRRLALWEMLGGFGVRTAVVNWWATWPAEWVDGYLVSDRFFLERFDAGPYGTRGHPDFGPVPERARQGGRLLTWPDSLDEELGTSLAAMMEARADPLLQMVDQALAGMEAGDVHDQVAMFQAALETDLLSTGAVEQLLARDDGIQVVATRLGSLDVALHLFLKYADPGAWQQNPHLQKELSTRHQVLLARIFRQAFQALDRQVARLRTAMGPETSVVLVATHGTTPSFSVSDRDFNLNRLLERLGLLVRKDDGSIDWERTRCYDDPTLPWVPNRQVSLHEAGTTPGDPASPDVYQSIGRDVSAHLKGLRVRPPYRTPDGTEQVNLFGFEQPSPDARSVAYLVVPVLPPGTEVQIGEEWLPIEELFPPCTWSASHSKWGSVTIALPGEEGERLAARESPLGEDVTNPVTVTPTVLALLGLAQPGEGGELAPPMLWILPPEVGQRAAIRQTVDLEAWMDRAGNQTPLGQRHWEAWTALYELGYLATAEPPPMPSGVTED